jgi:hypothetical protein
LQAKGGMGVAPIRAPVKEATAPWRLQVAEQERVHRLRQQRSAKSAVMSDPRLNRVLEQSG